MDSRSCPRRALVTGATGYIGSCLVRQLVATGWQVSVILRPESDLSRLNAMQINVTPLVHDGTMAGMVKLVAASRPDTVFHLASLFLAQHYPKDIDALVASNILFGAQLVEAMTSASCSHLISVGTSWQHYGGDDYNPVNLYAATKQAFDDILRYYLEASQIKATTLTLFDTYGPHDPRRKLIPLLRDAVLHGTALQMSPGEQLIDLVYIDDVITALLRAAALLQTQDSVHSRYGISSGQALSLKNLVALIERVTAKPLIVAWGGRPYRPREVMLPFCPHPPPPGWTPSVPLDQGITRVMREHD